MNSALKEKLLRSLYQVYESFIDQSSFACRKGCSSCCTQSVYITELEGRTILRHVEKEGNGRLDGLTGLLAKTSPSSPTCTTNQFARYCFQGKDCVGGEDTWSFLPCVFLHGGTCSVYPVRPFVCRSFASTVCCEGDVTAHLPTAIVSLNSTVMQVVEHIDQGKIWGNMNTVLALMLGNVQSNPKKDTEGEYSRVLRSQPCPGFLIPPEDERNVLEFIKILYDTEVEGKSFGKWMSAES